MGPSFQKNDGKIAIEKKQHFANNPNYACQVVLYNRAEFPG